MELKKINIKSFGFVQLAIAVIKTKVYVFSSLVWPSRPTTSYLMSRLIGDETHTYTKLEYINICSSENDKQHKNRKFSPFILGLRRKLRPTVEKLVGI